MVLLKAILRPDKVDAVKEALGKEYNVSLLPKIEVVLPDELVEAAVQAVSAKARTGEIGDGRIFLTPVTASYRIRTGELVM